MISKLICLKLPPLSKVVYYVASKGWKAFLLNIPFSFYMLQNHTFSLFPRLKKESKYLEKSYWDNFFATDK